MDPIRRSLTFGLAAACLPVWSGRLLAQSDWPSHAVTFVVPFPPGGSNDVIARLFAERYADALKQPFVVENKPGANGNIAAAGAAKAAPDGYTILVSGNGQNAMNHALYARMPYDSDKDFVHIVLLASTANAIVVPADSPIKTFADLLKLAREKGEELPFGSPGSGSSGHLSLATLENAAGFKVRHVPYRGAAPLVIDVLGGHVTVGIVNVDIPLPHVQTGKLRVLAVTSAQRSPLYPDAPTIAESGFPGFEAVGWIGLSAPVGTPPAVVTRINTLANAFLQDEKIKQRFAQGGYIPGGGTPQDYAAFVSREIVKWRDVVSKRGIALE